jgi:hypothetical protein
MSRVETQRARWTGAIVLGAALAAALAAGCQKKTESQASGAVVSAAPAVTPASVGAATPAAPAGTPPPDGKYERVIVDGVTVPMINVMNRGTVVLVDTDGKKPRSWEEQYKKKRAGLLEGQFDLHKTNANKNDSFEDDPIDREGLWVIDAKGNITRH